MPCATSTASRASRDAAADQRRAPVGLGPCRAGACRAGTARTPLVLLVCSTSSPRCWPAGSRSPLFEQAALRFPGPAGAASTLVAYLLPAAGLAGHPLGQRRLRPALPGPGHRRVQAGRPRRRSTVAAERLASSPSPPRPTCPVSRSASSLLGALIFILLCRYLARQVLHLVRRRAGHGRAPDGAGRHAARGARGLHGGHPQPGRRPDPGRHPPHRRLRGRPAASRPRSRSTPAATCSRWSARSAPTRSRSAARPAPSPASCAGWPGSSRAPASTWSSRRSSPTSPARGCTSARSRACRCCTSRSRPSPARRWLAKNLLDRVAAVPRPARAQPAVRWSIAIGDPALRPRPGLLPPAAGRPRGPHVPGVEVPHHVRRRRGAPGRAGRPERDRRHALQDQGGPADLPGRPLPAGQLARRAAPADQRAAGRDVAGRPAPAARRRRRLPGRRAAPAAGAARASPACGRSPAAPTCPGTRRSGSTSTTSTTGRSPTT